MALNWRYFSLEQVNNHHGTHWRIWEQPAGYPSEGLVAFLAAEAARRQGEAAFNRFHFALLCAKHEQRRNMADTSTLVEVAEKAELDVTRFRLDLTDRRLLARLAEDHIHAVEVLGVFGTPTLVFSQRQAFFLKMSSPPPPEDARAVFTDLQRLADQRDYIQEIKRPAAPRRA